MAIEVNNNDLIVNSLSAATYYNIPAPANISNWDTSYSLLSTGDILSKDGVVMEVNGEVTFFERYSTYNGKPSYRAFWSIDNDYVYIYWNNSFDGFWEANLGFGTQQFAVLYNEDLTQGTWSVSVGYNTLKTLYLVNTIELNNNNVYRSISEKFADVVNVKDYGAVGNGTFDDTAAFTRAVTASPASVNIFRGDNSIPYPDVVKIFVPPGTYNLTSLVTTGGRKVIWELSQSAKVTNYSNLNGKVLRAGERISNSSPFGIRDNAVGMSVMSRTSDLEKGAEVTGITNIRDFGWYSDRDSVSFYSENISNSLVADITSATYGLSSFTPGTSLTTDQVKKLVKGMIIETKSTPKWTGIISSWTANGSTINTTGWVKFTGVKATTNKGAWTTGTAYVVGDYVTGQNPTGAGTLEFIVKQNYTSSAGIAADISNGNLDYITGIPGGGTGARINPFTKIWAHNANVTLTNTGYASAATGFELGVLNNLADPIDATSSPVMWGMDVVNLGTYKASVAYASRGSFFRAYEATGADVSLYSINAQDRDIVCIDSNAYENFVLDANSGRIELGNTNIAGTRVIDFRNSGTPNNDYDCRIRAVSGTNTNTGQGYMSLMAARVGIGTENPNTRLTVVGTTSSNNIIFTDVLSSTNANVYIAGTQAGYGLNLVNDGVFDSGTPLLVDGRVRLVHGMTFQAGTTNFANGSDHSHVQWAAQNRQSWQMIQNGGNSATDKNTFTLHTVGINSAQTVFNNSNIYNIDTTTVVLGSSYPYTADFVKVNYNTDATPRLSADQFINVSVNPGMAGIVANTYAGTVSAGPLTVTVDGATRYQYVFSLELLTPNNWLSAQKGSQTVFTNTATGLKSCRVLQFPSTLSGTYVGLTGNYLNIPRYVLVNIQNHNAFEGETIILRNTSTAKINLTPAAYNGYIKQVIDTNQFIISVISTGTTWVNTSGTYNSGNDWYIYKGATDSLHQYSPALYQFYFQRFPTSDTSPTTTGGNRAVAIGNSTDIDGDFSYALGHKSSVFANHATILGGENNIVQGDYSTAVGGIGLSVSGTNQFVIGKYNKIENTSTKPLVVGWGSSNTSRSNILELSSDGTLTVSGGLFATKATITGNLTTGSNYVVTLALTANQTITQGSDIVINFDPKNDPNNWFSRTAGTGLTARRITPTIPGYYYINYQLHWQPGAVGIDNQNNIQIMKSNAGAAATTINISQQPINSSSVATCQMGNAISYFNGSTDYVYFQAYTANTTSQTVVGESNGTWTKVEMFKIN